MMRYAILFGLLGLAMAIGLFIWQGVGPVLAAFTAAGFSIVFVSLSHFISMLLNARAWQVLLPTAPRRPTTIFFLWVVWLRESVNNMLPVARIGGEIVTGRLLIRHDVAPALAVAGLIADITIFLGVQLVFTLIGVGLLITQGHASIGIRGLVIGALIAIPLLGIFIAVQKFGLFALIGKVTGALLGDRFTALVGDVATLDNEIRRLYRRHAAIIACCGWQFAGLLASSGEIWLSLYVLQHPAKFIDAVIIESLIQALSSSAFVVPGALGVQEGGFVVIGGMLGLTPELSLALALMRRARDVMVFVPALAIWQFFLSKKLWLDAKHG